jgi:hypothetical protein
MSNISISDHGIEREELQKKLNQLDRYIKKVRHRIANLAVSAQDTSFSVISHQINQYSKRNTTDPEAPQSHEC